MPGKTDHDDKAGQDEARTARTGRVKGLAAGGDLDTGAALRSVYQKTVEEAVPDEMLDLLGRLD